MSDSRVRVMSTYALSILPDEVQDKSGNKVKLNKSDPNIYLIPIDDARRIIRVATRSAYAEACQLYDLEKANFQAMYLSEQARNVWSKEQMMFIQALHTFSTSYFAGNVKITEQADTPARCQIRGGQAQRRDHDHRAEKARMRAGPEGKGRRSDQHLREIAPAPPPAAAAPQPPASGMPRPREARSGPGGRQRQLTVSDHSV